LRQNQESFIRLKHYRPFCFKQTLFGTTRVRRNAHKKPEPNLPPIIKSRVSIYLLILSVAAFGGPRRPAAETASTASTALQWQVRDTTDQMTDKTTREAVSGATLDDGLTLQAHATCDPVGMQFLFDTFQGRDPAPFTQTDNGIPMRVRIDNESVRIAEAQANYTNEAAVDFFDPATAQKLISGAYPGGHDPTDILAPVNRARTEILMEAARRAAPGMLQQLAAAKSIRVELSLTNGRSYVVDLNPQDDALKAIVQQCMADLHVGTGIPDRSGQGARQGSQAQPEPNCVPSQGKPEQRHVASQHPSPAEIWCKPGRSMIVIGWTYMRSPEEYDPRKACTSVPVYYMSPGMVVDVVSKESASLPSNAEIPGDRCLVSYSHGGRTIVGTIEVKALN
jgi:hypothetical protein